MSDTPNEERGLVALNLDDPVTQVWAEIYRQGWNNSLSTQEVARYIKEFGRKDKPGWAKKIISGLADLVAERKDQITHGHLHERTD